MAAVYMKYMKLCSAQAYFNMKILRVFSKMYYAVLFHDCVYIFFCIIEDMGSMCYLFHDQLRGGHSDTDSFLLQCAEHFCIVQITA